MMVPAYEYPQEQCCENGGLGWEVEIIRSIAGKDKAKIRYAHHTDAKGRPYEMWVRLSQLRPLPEAAAGDENAVFAISQDVGVLDAAIARLSQYAPTAWAPVLDGVMTEYETEGLRSISSTEA